MSYIGSDAEQDKPDFRRQRSSSNLVTKSTELWNAKREAAANCDDSDSEISDSGNFLAKGAFLITPSHELSMDRAAMICEKMNFKGCFSLTKTATGILFKFSSPEDYQAVFKKGFHKVTNARFYRKIAIPCRPQKTFTLYVFDVPEEMPEEDVRHALYKFNSIVEVVRLVVQYQKPPPSEQSQSDSPTPKLGQKPAPKIDEQDVAFPRDVPPPPIRVTLASIDEFNILLQNGLDFYGATFFPTEVTLPANATRISTKRGGRMADGSIAGRVRELLPVFDSAGFSRIPPPSSKVIKPNK